MKKDYTLLCPQMSPIHFDLLEPAIRSFGYKIEVLQNHNRNAVDVGLQYVNNDACYRPSLSSDKSWTPCCQVNMTWTTRLSLMSQTGGGCRASNYIGFIRRALERRRNAPDTGYLVNANGMEPIRLYLHRAAAEQRPCRPLFTAISSCGCSMPPGPMRRSGQCRCPA
ncbi:MAG: hypothetical protein ACLR0U_28995 [Enterocloster clostridioformis]